MSKAEAIVIVGGGPVGWSAALAAVQAFGAAHPVQVIEPHPAAIPAAGSAIKTRVYLLAEGHRQWLDDRGVVLPNSRCASVQAIQVHGRDGHAALCIDALDAGCAQLGVVVEHDSLTAAIAARAQELGARLEVAQACDLPLLGGDRLVETNRPSLHPAALAILADGKQSNLRDKLFPTAMRYDYEQTAVVAHFRLAHGDGGIARQWFLPDGSILALLPLADPTRPAEACTNAAVSLVWSMARKRAEVMLEGSSRELMVAVQEVIGTCPRLAEPLGAALAFPLSMTRLADPVGERLLAIGDAAHGVHPLAGQGVNLGLADARVLSELWMRASGLGQDPGAALLLAAFRRRRYAAVLRMQAAIDGLWRLYNQAHPLLAELASPAMRMLSGLPAFRRLVSAEAVQRSL